MGKEKNGTLMAGYLYAGGQIVAETDAGGNVTERFVYATRANVPDYMLRYNADGTTSTYRIVSDQVGSVREVIDASTGEIAQQIDYDVWGNIASDTDPGFQPFAFAGGLYDADTGLVHFGARDYDPETACWINRDPILFAGGSSNLFEYVIDDPVNGIDPSGNQGIAIAISPEMALEPALASEGDVAEDPIGPPEERVSPQDFMRKYQAERDQYRPGIQQPKPLPQMVPDERWYMIAFRFLSFFNNWPWGSLGIGAWINPCQQTSTSTSKEKKKQMSQQQFNRWCSQHPGWCV